MKFLILLLPLLLLACTPKIVTPPLSVGAMQETPRTVESGQARVAATVGAVGEIFSAGMGNADLQIVRPIGPRAELVISPVFQQYDDGSDEGIPGYQKEYSLAYGVDFRYKKQAQSTRHLAWFAGAGGAYNHYATWVSAYLGGSLAYENRYLVPFLDGQMYLAVPLVAEEVHVSGGEYTAYDKDLQATTTVGALVSAGLSLRLASPLELKGAMMVGVARSTTDELRAIGVSFGASYTF